jgi:hypothetical protein
MRSLLRLERYISSVPSRTRVEDLRTGSGEKFDPERAIAVLRSFREGDEADAEEQRETLELLMKGLNEGRLPGYELFP